ncbi:MAG: hypothetical protein HC765_14155 [Brachymonas sp.]|nr:hypothetical protein [Brachymonas sp.]
MTKRKSYEELRSARWFAPDDLRGFGHRSRAMQMGYDHADWQGKPIIAILNTWSDIGNCHSHFKNRVEEVKRGVLQAGGFPLEIPCISVAENFVKPTTMLYRNLLAIEAEEQLRCHPVDGAVLMGGCDKTTPGLLMGAFSAGLPCIYLPAGPMLRGNWKGKTLGSGSDAWKYWDERRAGNITDVQWMEIEGGIARSAGTCMVMGTAATMMGIAEALGMTLPGASSIPAVDANHQRMATQCGRRIVDMVWEDLTPNRIVTGPSCRNAAIVAMALAALGEVCAVGQPLEVEDRELALSGPHEGQVVQGVPSAPVQTGPRLDHDAIDVLEADQPVRRRLRAHVPQTEGVDDRRTNQSGIGDQGKADVGETVGEVLGCRRSGRKRQSFWDVSLNVARTRL